MSRSQIERLAMLLVLGVLGGAWIFLSREPAQRPRSLLTEAPIVGHLAPEFTVGAVDGEEVVLADIVDREGDSGRPVVLNFWASWCGPCRIETPHFQDLSLLFQDELVILGINQGESPQTITDFGASFGLTYPLLHDATNQVNDDYNVFNLPTTIFIDRHGVVREVYVGAISRGVLMERINGLVGE